MLDEDVLFGDGSRVGVGVELVNIVGEVLFGERRIRETKALLPFSGSVDSL